MENVLSMDIVKGIRDGFQQANRRIDPDRLINVFQRRPSMYSMTR